MQDKIKNFKDPFRCLLNNVIIIIITQVQKPGLIDNLPYSGKTITIKLIKKGQIMYKKLQIIIRTRILITILTQIIKIGAMHKMDKQITIQMEIFGRLKRIPSDPSHKIKFSNI